MAVRWKGNGKFYSFRFIRGDRGSFDCQEGMGGVVACFLKSPRNPFGETYLVSIGNQQVVIILWPKLLICLPYCNLWIGAYSGKIHSPSNTAQTLDSGVLPPILFFDFYPCVDHFSRKSGIRVKFPRGFFPWRLSNLRVYVTTSSHKDACPDVSIFDTLTKARWRLIDISVSCLIR